ncbi:MAG: Gram-negative bacterial tonB protein [Syntrophus sp. PtaU1.Bin208]|nr:MAG: Gram-negative bacterial tonB protein [Syntrophus sp. PtaU1.Bin208]
MKQDQTISIPNLFWKSAMPKFPGKDFLYAGMASLALHGFVILLFIAAGGLFSVPARMESSPELKVTLVAFSPSFPSQASSASVHGEKSKSADGRAKREGISIKALPENRAAGGQAPGSQARKKPGETLLLPDPREAEKRVPVQERKISAPAGSDLQTERIGAALSASFMENGNGQGKEALASGRGIQKNGESAGEVGGTSSLTRSRYQHNPPPVYPQAARRNGYEGLVLISVEILENGAPGQLLVKKSSGYAILDQAALSAVRKWRFVPAEKNALRIRSWGDVPIRFVLQDSR